MIYWNRRLRGGYSDLGPIQIPSMPQGIVLTDRADGTLYLVSFNTTPPEHLSITTDFSTIQHREGVRIYAADDGPKMDEDGEFTLIISNGQIGFDYTPFPRKVLARDDAPPFARQNTSQRAQRQIIMDSLEPAILHIGIKT